MTPLHGGGQTDRQTDRKTDRQTDRQTDRKTDRRGEREKDICIRILEIQMFSSDLSKSMPPNPDNGIR